MRLFAYSTKLDTDLLTIRSVPVVNGRDIVEEYFAIGGDSLQLVRLEDSKGTAVQNEYVFPNSRSASFRPRSLCKIGLVCCNRETKQMCYRLWYFLAGSTWMAKSA